MYLGLDQGTSATKAVLIDTELRLCSEAEVPITPPALNDGIWTQDPTEILESLTTAIDEILKSTTAKDIKAMGLSAQRSGVLAWEHASGAVLHPMLSWKDISTQGYIDKLISQERFISSKTGLPLSAHYAGGKFSTLQKQFSAQGQLVALLDTFLSQQLLSDKKSFSTEDSFASRTMLYDLTSQTWDPKLCKLFNVDMARLPEIKPTLCHRGTHKGIPLNANIGDQQAAYLGLCRGEEIPVLNLGSIASLLVATGTKPVIHPAYISNVLYSEGEGSAKEVLYQIEATTNCCGAIIEYLLQNINSLSKPEEIDAMCHLAIKEGKTKACAFYPLGAIAAPDWRSDISDVIIDNEQGDDLAFALALMQNLGSFIALNIEAFSKLAGVNMPGKKIIVSGGVSASNYLLQYISDCTGFELHRAQSSKASALGVAIAAMQGTGEALCSTVPQIEKIFTPQASEATEAFAKWKGLRARVLKRRV